MSNGAMLAGHVTVEDHVVIGGYGGIHQFCRLGAYAMLSATAKLVHDLPPFFIADGTPAEVRAVVPRRRAAVRPRRRAARTAERRPRRAAAVAARAPRLGARPRAAAAVRRPVAERRPATRPAMGTQAVHRAVPRRHRGLRRRSRCSPASRRSSPLHAGDGEGAKRAGATSCGPRECGPARRACRSRSCPGRRGRASPAPREGRRRREAGASRRSGAACGATARS